MIGRTISHYKILEELGHGGMGVVYKAEDTRLERTVALKFLPPHLTRDEDAKARFVHEARAASALEHPNICTIHEIDETDDGGLFICMACYEGETLKDKIGDRPLDLTEAVGITMQVAEGLAQAHERDIVHRDLKPANIFITGGGNVRIVDFGLAKLAGKTKLTKTGMTTGTVAYMSPEQARGQEVDSRSDIWSLGVTLYEMVTGRAPFGGDYEEAVVYSILNEPAEPVTGLRSGVPMELERIIERCMEKDPADRYQTARDLSADLRRLQRTMSDKTGTTAGARDASPGTKRRWRLTGAAILVLALVVVTAIVWRARGPSETGTSPDRKTLVVLPFENLGSPDDAYFAAGITEEITSHLASFGELAVISRKSAVHYAGTDKTTKEIGGELQVAYVLEGTVRWARDTRGQNRVRIVPELVRVADDTRLWSETYDRVIEDVFDIQSDIATRVATRLDQTLIGRGEQPGGTPPTDNLEAYQAYLRGMYYTRLPHFTATAWLKAIESYERAVELDPGFARAYARLSEAHARLYYFRYDLSDKRRELAKTAVDEATRLQPDLPDVHLASGYYHLMVERDVDEAFAEFARAPQNAEALEAEGDGYRQKGKWSEAFDHYEQAARLSPRNSSPLVEIAITGWLCREYTRAIDAADRAISIAPDQAWPYLAKGVTYWSWRGASIDARKAFELVPASHNWWPWVWYWQLVYEGRYQEALDHLSTSPGEWIRIKIFARPKAMYRAFVHEALGRADAASASYDTAATLLEAQVEETPADPRYHASLGIAYAALGRETDAIREGKKAMELLPPSKDAIYGLPYLFDMAHIYTLLGEDDEALVLIDELLKNPSNLSVPVIEVDPRWNRLRDNPEFRRLLKTYSPTDA